MNASAILLALVVFLVVVAVMVGGCAMTGRNEAVSLDENVKQEWAKVETQLERRFDLIPNVEATVKGTALQEKTIFIAIAEARSANKAAMTSGSTADRVKAANNVENSFGGLRFPMMLQENYPELKSNEAFKNLIVELEGTENRIGTARDNYNDAVKGLNTYVRGFPSGIWCNYAGVKEGEYFKAAGAAKTAPKIDFSDDKKPAPEPKPNVNADPEKEKQPVGK